MKKIIPINLLLTMAFSFAMVNPLSAQSVNKNMEKLAKTFEKAYNHKDINTLKNLYTNDAERVNINGTTTTGNSAIADSLTHSLNSGKLKISITVDKTSDESDGSVTAEGTYHVTGTNNSGEKVDFKGGYTNRSVMDGGKWKIAKSVLVSLQ